MVEQPNPQLLRAVMERDRERAQRIHYERATHALKLQNERLRREVQRLTIDKAAAVNLANRRLRPSAKT